MVERLEAKLKQTSKVFSVMIVSLRLIKINEMGAIPKKATSKNKIVNLTFIFIMHRDYP
jgi:hypothetical protein